MTAVAPIVGAVEAGGTKFVCAVGRGPGAAMLAREQFATGDDPVKVLGQVTAGERNHDRVIAAEQDINQDDLSDHQPVQMLKKFKHAVSCLA